MTGDVRAVDRVRWLGRNGTRLILAIVLLGIATLVGASWSLAVFTSSSANPRNTVSAGSMSQTNTAGNTAIMGASGMVPGDVVEGSATIENVGDAQGQFTLRVRDLHDVPGPQGGVLSSQLQLEVFDTSGAEAIWSGPLDGLDVGLGTWEPGETRSYRFEVRFPEEGPSADNAYQRSRVTATFEWSAVQAR